jgi:hypothetical protein
MLHRPVLGQIHPSVVLLLPAKVAELTNGGGGEIRLRQSRDPKPFMIGGVRDALAGSKSISFQYFLGADHAHRFRVINGERQAWSVPKLDAVGLLIVLLGEAGVGRPARK